MRILSLLSCILLSIVTTFGQINSGSPAIPFGSKIAAVANPYGNGILPTNLPTGAYNPGSNQFGMSQDAADAYNTWKTNYVTACGSNFRVNFDTPSQTVSEGIGYGMLLAAYAGDKPLFDGLWGYYKANSDGNGLMNWRTGNCTPDQSGGATDADLDAAMALLVAKCQWPSATSPYNYNTEATTLITAIKNTEIHNTTFQAINGDGWGFGSTCRNPSYQSPAYYRQFAAQITSQASTWNSAVTAAYTLLNANRNTTTGLISNWSDPSGVPNSCNGNNEYGYDACRNPWRMAVDVLWYGTSTAQTNFCVPIAAYVNGKGAANAGAPIPQAGGTGLVEASFVSTFAAGICGSNSTYQTIMNSMYTQTLATTDALPRYFGNTLRVLSLFVQTGNFWKPCNAAPLTISVALTAPTSGQLVNEGTAITLTATASTTNGTITKVEFYNGTTLIGTATSSPYTISWTGAPAGPNQIVAKAYNSNSENASTTATPIFVIKVVNQAAPAPTIDGSGTDAVWGGSNTSASLNNLIGGSISGPADLSANYEALWDANNFYLLVNVTDDVKVNNGGTDYYNDDAVEVFFNIGNVAGTSYGANDFQYTFRWNDNTIYEKNNKTTGVTFKRVDNATGYVMEMSFPWSTLTGTPAVNQLVGFDVEVDDDDDGGARDGKISWAASADQAWTDPSYMGTVILKGLPCSTPSAAGSITGTTTLCAGTAGISYSIANVTGATSYNWTLPTGATITSGANTNSITVTFATSGGSVTVTPVNTCGNGTSSTSTITINPTVTPSVTISASATTICTGTSVTFTPTPVNGGTPTYQWRNNSTNIAGATGATYTSMTLANGDKIDVVMTSTAACSSSNTATSTQTTMVVNATVTPSVTIAASATTICSGTSVTFTPTPQNGGTPTYQWRNNSTNIAGATGATYTSTTLANGDKIDVVMTSTAACSSSSTATSAQTTMTVNAIVIPSVTIAASATSICAGTSATFTAIPQNGGTPTYQWRNNSTNIAGATGATYTSTTLANGDKIDVVMTSTAACSSSNTATSTQTTMVVNAIVTPSVTISASATSICAGTSVTFTAIPQNGGTPTYQWRNNSTNIAGATGTTYTSTTLANGDKVDVIMTSTASCSSSNTATSTQTAMTVNAIVIPSVTIAASATTICAGASVTFTATPQNGGTPTYQWRTNSTNITGATGKTFISTTLANGDKVDVVMTSTATCSSPSIVTSIQTAMTVNSSVIPSVTIAASATTICAGTSVTFTATPQNGGTPTYQWRTNNTNIAGATGTTYTSTTVANGDKVDVIMTSTATCRSANTATSTKTTMTVNANVTPSVTVSASQTTICAGTGVTFTATPVNAGTPIYQWRNNSTNIAGATGKTFTSTTLANGDKVDVVMTSTATCSSPSTVTSTQTAMTVNTSVVPSVTVSASQTTICTGSSVTYIATPVNGGTPTYQWRKNATNIAGATSGSYVTSTIANGDQFDVVMTSTAACRTTNTATSAKVTMTIATSVTASVSISVTPGSTIYAGQSATFTATPVNGGTPTYQWQNGSAAISGATNATYTSTSLANGDVINVAMVSNAGCVSNTNVVSNSISMVVNQNPAFDTSISGPTTVAANASTVTYSVPNAAGMQYTWSVPPGATIVSGQGTNSIVVDFGSSSGNVSVLETNPVGQTSTITVPIVVGTTTPTILPDLEASVLVYPVPCNDNVTIDMGFTSTEKISYLLIDATGNIVRTGTFEYAGIPVQIETTVAAGVYQLILHWNDKTTMNRIAKL
jgi:endo-1,4-beta-D-glucanase Y